jgi:MoaA/NifB/PqqE/SkfB family radical SAM enzyme
MPYFSSVWASLKNEYQKSPRNNDGVIQYLKENANSIKHGILLGGEPFLQKKNLELIEIISDNTTLHFVTNLSFGPLENNHLFQKLLEKKNHISFSVSFETIGETLANNCADNTNDLWSHDLLKHNETELERMREIIKPFLRGMVVGRARLTPQQVSTPTNITSQQIKTMPTTPPIVMVPGIVVYVIFHLLMAALNQSTTLYPC